MIKNKELGFYNKYIFNNNSYLSLYLIKKIYKKHSKSKDLFELIDKELEDTNKILDLRNLKNKIKNNNTKFTPHKKHKNHQNHV